MRLINADVLKRKFNKTNLKSLGFFPNNVVDSCRTVNAIPVTWIKDWQRVNPSDNVSNMLADWEWQNEKK